MVLKMNAPRCEICGTGNMMPGRNSALYCLSCGTQSLCYMEEEFDKDDGQLYNSSFKRDVENAEQHKTGSSGGDGQQRQDHQDTTRLTPEVSNESVPLRTNEAVPLPASQFGQGSYPIDRISDDTLASMIRSSYVGGLQKILQLQCETLVKQFGVTPLICGIVGPIWLKYVASTRLFEKAWAKEAIQVAEHGKRSRRGNKRGRRGKKRRVKKGYIHEDGAAITAHGHGDGAVIAAYSDEHWTTVVTETHPDMAAIKMRGKKRERKQPMRKRKPRTSLKDKSLIVWLNALKDRIPLSITLALCYLSCYIARESVLPTDITKWANEGQLPYLAAFVEITKPAPNHILNTVEGKQFFPVEPGLMFRPEFLVGSDWVELQAGFIAERVGIQPPPVNFHAISARLLTEMRLPVKQLSGYIGRLYDWYIPSGLWLSGEEGATPTTVYVMAMLIIAMKILYKLDGCHLQHQGLYTLGTEQRVLSTKHKGTGGHFQAPHSIVTRAMVKAQVSVDASHPVKTVDRVKTGETNASQDHLSAPKFQVLGKRKRLPTTGSVQDGGSNSCGKEKQILGEINDSKLSATNARFQEDWKEPSDAKELVKILESVKTQNTMNYEERLASYLKYCKDIVFPGYDLDENLETAVEWFWEIYEKVPSELLVDSAKETAEKRHASVGLHGVAGGILGDNAKEKCRNSTEVVYRAPTAESFLRDVPSASSLRTNGNSRPERSKQQKQKQKDNRKIRGRPHNNQTLAPASKVDRGYVKMRHPSSLMMDMKNAGFSYLPFLAQPVGSDVYLMYKVYSDSELVQVHGDYFNLLRSCGKLINTDAATLHSCVQALETELLQVETNVENFLLGQNGQVAELAEAVKRVKPPRSILADDKNAERIEHMTDLSYI